MDLTTKYLGLNLRTPLVVSASPLSNEIDDIKLMEECGASAVVLHSLFEEQIIQDRLELHHHLSQHTDSYAEALTYFPEPSEFFEGPAQYLKHIEKAKKAVKIPIIASLNGNSPGGWIDFSKQMESAGADAIEMNIYDIPTDMYLSPETIEESYIEIVREVRSEVKIPISLKLSPYFTNLAYAARRFVTAGADGLVLFNRFYQPDFDLDTLVVKPHVLLSTPHDLRLPLRWIAILFGNLTCDFAGTSGVHKAQDAIKLIMAGANIAMLNSVLIREGIEQLKAIEAGMIHWMKEHEYESITQMRGSMSQKNVHNPHEYERVQYMKALNSVHIHTNHH